MPKQLLTYGHSVSVLSITLLWLLLTLGLTPTVMAATATVSSGDMIAPTYAPDQCLTVDGSDVTTAPPLAIRTCRSTPAQQWQRDPGASQWRSGLDSTYCLASVGANVSAGGALTVRPCTDTRALTLAPDPVTPTIYDISGTVYVLDAGVYGQVAAAFLNGWDYQHWHWFQDDLDLVNQSASRVITYPLPVANTLDYQIETARDRVAKVQPPYVPPVTRDPSVYPGVVPSPAPTVTRSFAFNLQFKDHSYLRMSTPPRNWQSTGLYAPADQILVVTVSNATASELSAVYIQIGVHTDRLKPTSGNVVNAGAFLRYPDVTTKVKLEPGVNLVRSPYGGTVLLVAEQSVNQIIDVTIANAVETPRFVAGQTSEAEWLLRRAAPGPWAEFESELAVAHVPSAQIRTLSYQDAAALAQHYTAIGQLHNQLAGLSADAAVPHQTSQGQQRHVMDRQISVGYGHNGFPLMYFDDWAIGRPADLVYRSGGWGVYHELGHNYQMGSWSYVYGTEVTVNLFSLFAQEQLFGNSRLVDENTYADALARLDDPSITDKWGTADPFEQLVFLDQIRLAFPALNWELWTQLMRRYRELSSTEYAALNNDQAKRDKFLVLLCEITQTNLTPHFEAWTVAITQAAKDSCAGYAPLTQPIWRIDGAQPFHPGQGSGQWRHEWWNEISGTQLIALTSAAHFPSHPSGSALVTGTLTGPTNWGNNYGQRLRAFLHPPVSGAYHFWLAGNESAQVRLSSDADPIHAQTIITLSAATGERGFDESAMNVQRSTPVFLQAGQRYYLEVLHKEGSGSDHVAVAWTIPAALPTLQTASRQMAAVYAAEPRKLISGRFLSPSNGDLALQQQLVAGQPATVQPGALVTLTLTVHNQGAVTAGPVELVDQLPVGFVVEPGVNPAWQSGYRYVRFVALTEAGNRGGWASMAELGLLDEGGVALPPDSWSILYQDSYQPGEEAANAIDNDPATIWHTPWGGTPGYPHEVQVDLGKVEQLSGFTYLPHPTGTNGRVGQYRFYVSQDATNWIEVATGTLADTGQLKSVNFTPPPPSQIFATLPGPLAPAASASLNLTLRATATLTTGLYVNRAEISRALDGTQAPFYDSDSMPDANASNDLAAEDDYTQINLTVGQALVDQDVDGVSDAVETAGPNQGDGNNDGTPDADQANVTSLPDSTGVSYLTLAVTGSCTRIEQIAVVGAAQSGGQDAAYVYPLGLADYQLRCPQAGQSATVEFYWHGANPSQSWQLRKYGPATPGAGGPFLWHYQPATITLATIQGHPVIKSSFIITDGQPGDATGLDGLIVDPIGPTETPRLRVSQQLSNPGPLRAGETIHFTIRITNTGAITLTTVPLRDLFTDYYLVYQSALPVPTQESTNQLTWSNVAPVGGLAPGGSVTVVVNFAASHDTTLLPALDCAAAGYTNNQAQVFNALANSSPVPTDADDSTCASIQIFAPTPVPLGEKQVRYANNQVTLAWQTGSESNLLGFNMWRTDSGGAWVKLNGTTISAQHPGQSHGASYQWVDPAVQPGQSYRYVLELLASDGSTTYSELGLVMTGPPLYLPLIRR